MYAQHAETTGAIDLRSDTVTHPTKAMRAAMAAAEVGDDQTSEDPSVNALEARSAELLGKAAGVFLPSGTMGNLASVMAHCQRGDEVVLGDQSHILWYESAGVATLGGISPRTVPTNPDGTLPLESVEAVIRPAGPGYPPTGAIALENTHNRCGGTVLPQDYLAEARSLADSHGLPLHLDGARIFNAAAYLGIPARDIAQYADSVQFCFSKGLAAPVGSMVVGSEAFVDRVRYMRKLLGGAMRQAGVIAAAAMVSLEGMIDRLPQDHARARTLAEAIAETPGYHVNLDTVQTNLVIFRTDGDQARVVAALKERGVLASNMGSAGIRLVTHYEITDDHISRAIQALREVAHV